MMSLYRQLQAVAVVLLGQAKYFFNIMDSKISDCRHHRSEHRTGIRSRGRNFQAWRIDRHSG